MFMNTFLHILKKILSEKYPSIEFDFYFSTSSKNVHMERNCNILSLSEHVNIISDIESIWKEKKQDPKSKFAMPQLIHTTKWKYDNIVFRSSI